MKAFSGKVALVTGAGSGIGRSMALAFVKERMNLIVVDINAASLDAVAGLLPDSSSTYGVAKAGVIALSECLAYQTRDTQIGVSVLCPGWVKTKISENSAMLAKKKQELFEASEEQRKVFQPFLNNSQQQIDHGTDPDIVARMVIDSIENNRFYF